jgi:hypothetical protein
MNMHTVSEGVINAEIIELITCDTTLSGTDSDGFYKIGRAHV